MTTPDVCPHGALDGVCALCIVDGPPPATTTIGRLSSDALDAVAIILTEARDLADEPTNAAANKIATIQQAAHLLELILGDDRACAFLTHSDNRLHPRYLPARDALRGA